MKQRSRTNPGRPLPPTEHELQIARLTADGVDNRTIAERLGMSHQTVRHILNNLYRKLGAEDSAHMVAILFRQAVLQ